MMAIGPIVRHRLGRWEVAAAKLYRGLFVDLPALADHLAAVTDAKRILEVGCGDGAVAEELTRAFPHADYLGIDVAETAGRLYRGDPDRARFRAVTVADFQAEDPEPFDLVCLVDVLHHIRPEFRAGVLACAAALTAPEGHLIIKDHDRDGRFSFLAYAADRFITGDKDVRLLSRSELIRLVGAIDGFGPIRHSSVPPLRSNVLLIRQRLAAGPCPLDPAPLDPAPDDTA